MSWTVGSRTENTQQALQWSPFIFFPVGIPGFRDYLDTFTHFRVLKCVMNVSTYYPDDTNFAALNYLVVGSRPFANTQGASTVSDGPAEYVPSKNESDLRQTRWQRVVYPSKSSTKVRIGFHPYTMVATFGPATTQSAIWPRVWEGKRWMPVNWAETRGAGNNPGLAFYGPYLVVQRPYNEDPESASASFYTVRGTLELMVQFKGQV